MWRRQHHWWHRNWDGYRDRYFGDDLDSDYDNDYGYGPHGRWAYDYMIWDY
jgi:hypothetical protein